MKTPSAKEAKTGFTFTQELFHNFAVEFDDFSVILLSLAAREFVALHPYLKWEEITSITVRMPRWLSNLV